MVTYEKVQLDDELPIRLFDLYYEDPGPEILKHWHKSIEILVPIIGQAEVWDNGNVVSMDNKWIYIVNSGNIHSVTLLPCNTIYKAYGLQINYQYLKKLYPAIDRFEFRQPKKEIAFQMLKIIYNMLIIQSNYDPYQYIALKGYTDVLIYIMIKNLIVVQKNSIKNYKHNNSKIVKIVNYIDQNYDDDLTLMMIADRFHISKSYLSRYFKECLGTSVKEYLNSVRLRKACFDLTHTNLPIVDIALKNGFPNVKSFEHVFKKNYQCTPGLYRKDYK